MDNIPNSESDSIPVTVKPTHSWAEVESAVQEEGLRVAKQLEDEGHAYKVAILAPREVKGGDTIPLSGVVLPLDWKIAKRLEMVEVARDLMTSAYTLDSLDHGLPTVLKSIIEGKGLYEHSIGEFFQLYGQFEGKYQLARQGQTKAKMEALVKGRMKYLKAYIEYGETNLVPLPYAVRNILAHAGTNPNGLDKHGEDLRKSIELLKSWVSPDK